LAFFVKARLSFGFSDVNERRQFGEKRCVCVLRTAAKLACTQYTAEGAACLRGGAGDS